MAPLKQTIALSMCNLSKGAIEKDTYDIRLSTDVSSEYDLLFTDDLKIEKLGVKSWAGADILKGRLGVFVDKPARPAYTEMRLPEKMILRSVNIDV